MSIALLAGILAQVILFPEPWIGADSTTLDSLARVCEERGHLPVWQMVTLVCPSERVVETDSCTMVIRHDPNMMRGHYRRCGMGLEEPIQAHPCTTVVWRREEPEDE